VGTLGLSCSFTATTGVMGAGEYMVGRFVVAAVTRSLGRARSSHPRVSPLTAAVGPQWACGSMRAIA
jgi:hypothetical protein